MGFTSACYTVAYGKMLTRLAHLPPSLPVSLHSPTSEPGDRAFTWLLLTLALVAILFLFWLQVLLLLLHIIIIFNRLLLD